MKYDIVNNLSTYEEVYNRLKNTLEEFLSNNTNNYIQNLYLKSKNMNFDTLENHLIETGLKPKQLVRKIKKSYLQRNSLKGIIGTLDGKEQYDGIINIALYMLMSNRLAKFYKYKILNNPYLDKYTKTLYNEKYKTYIDQKRDALIKLVYSLFIYKETVNNDTFFYGHSFDTDGNDTFIIDLPSYSQIGVHFGSETRLRSIKYLAKKNIKLILQEKLQLKQISQREYNKIMSKLGEGDILPEYTGKFYEKAALFPIDELGRTFQLAQRILQLNEKTVDEINNDDIKKMSQNGCFNNRELHYFAVKSSFSKSQLEMLSKHLKEKDKYITVKSLGEEAKSLTTAQERQQVSTHEKISNCDFTNLVSISIGGKE